MSNAVSSSASRRALIVIDVQNEYVTGNLPIEYPSVDTSLANIGRAIDAAHAAGVPVIVVQHVAPAGAPIFAPGTDGVALQFFDGIFRIARQCFSIVELQFL